MKVELKHTYLAVKGDQVFYGGNQKMHPMKTFQKDGCGVIAGTDISAYLEGCFEMEEKDYYLKTEEMYEKFLPFRKNHGMSGFVFARGMNRYWREHQLPYHVSWGLPGFLLYNKMRKMLEQDIPVVLTVGPAAPWRKSEQGVNLYQKTADGRYEVKKQTRGHYMTVTGMNEKWLRVSSWGEKYYIDKKEYLTYAKKVSFYFYTNAFYIKRKDIKRTDIKRMGV